MITVLMVARHGLGADRYAPGELDSRGVKVEHILRTDDGFALVYPNDRRLHVPMHRVLGWEDDHSPKPRTVDADLRAKMVEAARSQWRGQPTMFEDMVDAVVTVQEAHG